MWSSSGREQGAGRGFVPFHGEKTPSFHVHEPRQFFHCFGCGEKGDVLTLPHEDRAAVHSWRCCSDLAGAAGVDLDRAAAVAGRAAGARRGRVRARADVPGDGAGRRRSSRSSTRRPPATAARAYVEKRGIGAADPRALSRRLRARPAGTRCQSHLAEQARSRRPIVERLGLVGVNERGRYDFFRDRVMLPVLDRQKRVDRLRRRACSIPRPRTASTSTRPTRRSSTRRRSSTGCTPRWTPIRRTGTRDRRRGQLRRAVAARGGHRGGRGAHGHGADRGADRRCWAGSPRRSWSCSTATRPGSARPRKAIPLFVEADVDGRIARMPAGVDPDDFVRAQRRRGLPATGRGARPMLDQFIQDVAPRATDIPGRVPALETVAAAARQGAKPDDARALRRAAGGRAGPDSHQQVIARDARGRRGDAAAGRRAARRRREAAARARRSRSAHACRARSWP